MRGSNDEPKHRARLDATVTRRLRVVATITGAAFALVVIDVVWNLLWAEATEQAYGRRWDDS